jgi:hypothetical protein
LEVGFEGVVEDCAGDCFSISISMDVEEGRGMG